MKADTKIDRKQARSRQGFSPRDSLLRATLLVWLAAAIHPAQAQELPGDTHAEEARLTAPLTLRDAIARGVEANPQTLSAAEGVNGSLALQRAARGAFLPNLSGAVAQQRRTVNLLAQGLDFPGIPALVGPYNVFDARLRLAETVFDWSKLLALRGAALETDLSRAQAALAREQIASSVSSAFIEVLSDQQRISAAQSDLDLARDLLKLSQDQRSAGVASGIDVARSETTVARDDFALSQASTALAQARLSLQRLLNVEQGSPLELRAADDFTPQDFPTVTDALKTARDERQELQLAQQQVTIAELDVRSARAAYLPNLDVTADYGLSSNTPSKGREDTYSYGAQLSVPIYSGGVIEAQVATAKSRLQQARFNAQDVDSKIEQDVRLSLATIHNTIEQVRAAKASRDLAERELQLARDRFKQGAANNLEVVQAQTEVSGARADYVSALAAYDMARASFAAAIGRAQQFTL
jgi:outer membrane protein TolC